MLKIDKNEQYALIIVDTNILDKSISEELEKKVAGLFREGYCNFIFDFEKINELSSSGIALIKKVEKICTNENGILVITTNNPEIILELDEAKIEDLAIFTTNEEAAEAIYLNELENDFREEEEEESDEFGEDSVRDYE
jgi:anti-anti-sigma regulatory factor